MEISPYKFNQPGADPKPDYVHVVSTKILTNFFNSSKILLDEGIDEAELLF